MSWDTIDLPSIAEYLDHPDQDWFKARRKNGDIVRVFNPAKLRLWSDKDGRNWIRRPSSQVIERADSKKKKNYSSLF